MNKQEDRKDGLKQILGENMWNSWPIGGGQLKKKFTKALVILVFHF